MTLGEFLSIIKDDKFKTESVILMQDSEGYASSIKEVKLIKAEIGPGVIVIVGL